jgi:hypothetical protein
LNGKEVKTSEQFLFLSRGRGSHDLGIHANKLAGTPLVFEFDYAVDHSEQRVILTAADILARLPLGATLSRQNVAAQNAFAPKLFQSQPLRMRVSPISRGAYAFFVSHFLIFDLRLLICDLLKTHEGSQSKI